jgi:hypothetical protein
MVELGQSLVQGPGDVWFGDKRPVGTYDPLAPRNELSVPGYAADLAGLGLGISGPGAMVRGGAVDASTLGTIPFWHGTGVDAPFSEFENRFLGSGEGAYAPNMKFEMGYGFHLSGRPTESADYRGTIAGHFKTRGGLVSGEIIPDQGDLLGWREKLGDHSPEFLERVTNGKYGYLLDPNHPEFIGSPWDSDPVGDILGSNLYKATAKKIRDEAGLDRYKADSIGTPAHSEKQRLTSEYFDSIGVPGIRSRDISGSNFAPTTLYHIGVRESGDYLPDLFHDLVTNDEQEFYRNHVAPYGNNLEGTVESLASHMEDREAELRQDYINGGTGQDFAGYGANEYENTARWVREQHARGNLQLGIGPTPTNYIMFDGRHINITHWDGRPVSKAMPRPGGDPTLYKDEDGNMFQLGHGPEAPPGLSASEKNAWENYFNHEVPGPNFASGMLKSAEPVPPAKLSEAPPPSYELEEKANNLWNHFTGGAKVPDNDTLMEWYRHTQLLAKHFGVSNPGDMTLSEWVMSNPKTDTLSNMALKHYVTDPEFKNKYESIYKSHVQPGIDKAYNPFKKLLDEPY